VTALGLRMCFDLLGEIFLRQGNYLLELSGPGV
jgi:hypothetical protein